MRYQNLDLWVERDASGRFLVQGKSSQGDFREYTASDLGAISIDSDGIAQGRIDQAALKALGQQLFAFLFRTGSEEKLEALLDRSLGALDPGKEGLRIRIQLDEANPDVAAMPWEFLYRPIDDRFLGTSLSTPIVRFLEVGVPIRQLEATLPLAMLVVIPAVEQLNVELEASILEETLAPMSKAVELTIVHGIVTVDRLQEILLKKAYDVIHFIGHGDFDGETATLRFNDETGGPAPVDHETLGRLLRNHLSLKLVVLNSCKGAALSASRAFVGLAPRLVMVGVPAVVAMQFPIRDDEALQFVKSFYGALFDSVGMGSIDFAISTARNALDTSFPGTRGLGVPALFMRYDEGLLFRVVTGNPLKDIPLKRADASRERALIHELERNRQKVISAGGPLDEATRTQLAIQAGELERAKKRLRLRTSAILAAGLSALAASLAFVIGLLDRLPLTWIMAATPIWLGDPVGASLDASRIAIVTARSIDTTWRPRHAAVVDKLSEAGARVILFDLFFQKARPADDSILGAAFARAKSRGTTVVFGARDVANGRPLAVPGLAEQATVGTVCLGENRARFSGIVPLVWASHDGKLLVPSVALAAVMAAKRLRFAADLEEHRVNLVDSQNFVVDRISIARTVTVSTTYADCPMVNVGSRYGEMLAARANTSVWRDPVRRVDYATIEAARPVELDWVRNKIVLIGSTAEDELSRRSIGGVSRDERYGIERHADAIATILTGAEIRTLGGGLQALIIALGATLGALIGYLTGGRRLWRDLGYFGLSALGFMLLGAFAYRYGQTLVDLLYPLVALLLTYAVVSLLRRRLLT